MNLYNPIQSVTPIDYSGNVIGQTITNVPCPSGFKYLLTDVSSSDAGRSENFIMNKMRKGQSRTVDLEWKYLTIAECSYLLNAFNSEYLSINYLDAKDGGWVTREFYVGDRATPLYNSAIGRWESISFTIIQRDADLEG